MAVATTMTKRTMATERITRDEFFSELDAAERRIQKGNYITESEMWAHERGLRARLLRK